MTAELPAGPRLPAAVQTLGFVTRHTGFLEQCRRRYGSRFTLRLVGGPPIVMISDPQEIKELMTALPRCSIPARAPK